MRVAVTQTDIVSEIRELLNPTADLGRKETLGYPDTEDGWDNSSKDIR